MPFRVTRTIPTPIPPRRPHTEEQQVHMMILALPTPDLTGKRFDSCAIPLSLPGRLGEKANRIETDSFFSIDSSNMANKADPRIDSDFDNRNDPTSRVGGYGTQGQSTHTGTHAGGIGGTHSGTHAGGVGGTHTGTHAGGVGGTTGAGYGTTGTSTNAGPHR